MIRSVILGTGSALPARRVSNAELAQEVDTTDEWIVERTGIRFRHIAGPDETTAYVVVVATAGCQTGNADRDGSRRLTSDASHSHDASRSSRGRMRGAVGGC